MKPCDAIASLERALCRKGEMIRLRRYPNPVAAPGVKKDVIDVPAFVRRSGSKPLAGTIDQGGWNVVVSPTRLGLLLPLRKGDKVIIDDVERNLEEQHPIYLQGKLVRINLMVKGL